MVISATVSTAIFLTSKKTGSVIDIATPKKGAAFHRVSGIVLEPGAAQNLYYHRAGWFLKKIEFRLPEISDPDFKIQARIAVKGGAPRTEDWSSIGKKVFCLNKRDENLKDAVLTISNNSASGTLKEDIQVFGLREGCNEWSGSLKYEWTDTKKGMSGQGILQATFTLKENAYATEYIVADGGYSYNYVGCQQDGGVKTFTTISDGVVAENAVRLIPLDSGAYELKLPAVWGRTDSAKEYTKKNRTCIYGRERGDVVRDLEESPVQTLKEIMEQKLVLVSDAVSGNLSGQKEIIKVLEDGTERKIKFYWEMARQ